MIIPQKISGRLALVFAFLSALNLCGQNLISNYSFEDTVSCPDDVSQIGKSKNWYSCGPTPDYYNACNKGVVGVPNNFFGFQFAEFGNSYGGIYISSGMDDIREVIGQNLSNQLTIGKKYYVGFKASLGDRSKIASNNLGVLFCTNSRESNSKLFKACNYAHIYSNEIIENYEGWTVISGSFIADSSYSFVMISNFFADSITKYNLSKSPLALLGGAYYYIDDVCVSEDSIFCYKTLKNETNYEIGLTINLFPNPFLDFINISSDAQIVNGEFVMYDVNLRQLLFRSFDGDTNIDVRELPQGIYYYTINCKDGRSKKGTIVK